MAFFSFSLIDSSLSYLTTRFEPNQIYFSKDIALFRELNDKKKKYQLNFIKKIKRKKTKNIGNKLLICLPPKFGLGDAIEYSIAIKSIIDSKKFTNIGIAFCSNYSYIFKNIFSFSNVYPLSISEKEINKFDTIFHITLEIEALIFQKYKRSNIVYEICKFFKVPINNLIINKKINFNISENKISIFPISTSVLRSMPLNIIKAIIDKFSETYEIEIFLDSSEYSKHLISRGFGNKALIKNPSNLEHLIKEISKINFGVFIDSGPLHIAKIFKKQGIFIETSVPANTLLENFTNINLVKNKYTSKNCFGPCGLVDVFAFNNKVGCYETNKISFEEVRHSNDFKKFQRWNKKENNSHFINNPVGCVKNIDIENVIKNIQIKLDKLL